MRALDTLILRMRNRHDKSTGKQRKNDNRRRHALLCGNAETDINSNGR